jgi:O-antigen biosynthesis protein
VLIAADRNPELLSACLGSLVRNVGPEVAYETVILLNGSPESVRRFVAENVRGAELVESPVNRGVAGGYNLARSSARGELLVLLHDDTEVSPGWLEALLAAADETPNAGAVGGRALDPDGTLQSAGALIHPDGTTEAVLDDGHERREVDYCSSNSLLVRAETWDAVGGLDERFYPAYHVDVDLGMKIREHGQIVLCEPRSQVIHHRRGISTDERFRVFAARRNLRRFVAKWLSGDGLAEQPPASDLDYLRLDVALKDAYIDELEQRVDTLERTLSEIAASRTWRLKSYVTRLVVPSRTGSRPSADRSDTYPAQRGRRDASGS